MGDTIDTTHDALERASASAAGCAALPIGSRLQEYRVDQVIGAGGFGIVYLAWDLALQRRVAIKEYMPTLLATREATSTVRPRTKSQAEVFETARRSFINEARMLARFKHPGLIDVLRFWEQNGTAYMVMPLYQGITLSEHLARHPKSVTQQWLTGIFEPVLSALAHMHAADCYHRDVAPDNVMVLDTGSAVLLDLGSARRVIADSTEAVTVMLKPGFAPVEQYTDDSSYKQGPWTDIYALSAVLYLAITGKPPHVSTLRVMRDNVVPLAMLAPIGYGSKFLAAIDKGLSIRPEDRPQSIAEFKAMLIEDSPSSPASGPASNDATPARVDGDRSAESIADVSAPHPERDSASGTTPRARRGTDTSDRESRRAADRRTSGAAANESRAASRRPANAGPNSDRRIRKAPVVAAALLVAVGLVAFFVSGTGEDRATGESAPKPAATVQTAPAASAAPAVSSDATSAVPASSAPIVSGAMPDTTEAPRSPAAPATPAATAAPAAAGASPGSTVVARPGVLHMIVLPWGEVFVDGVSKGVSPPLKQLELPPGQHKIELRNPGAATVVKQIVVKPGEDISLTHRF